MAEFASFLIPAEVPKNKKNSPLVQSLNFDEPETPISIFDHSKADSEDTMRIFLRLRPGVEEWYATPNNCDVVAIPPPDSASFRNFTHGYGITSQKFTFSKLFTGSTDQETIFTETTKKPLRDFVKGSDRLLFTYGTTSSGKTYTMNGQKGDVGIIPRSLLLLFNSVQLSNDASAMPVDFSEISNLQPAESQRILKEKATLLKMSEKESSDVLTFLRNKDNNCENLSDYNNEYKTTFWITYTEIYNENIFDLLDITQCQNVNNKNIKRPILDIRTARNGGSYVKGLSCYPAFSAEEAYRLLLVGRRSQKTGATRLNQNSSRSHTIFTIRAVRTSVSNKYLTRVSNFSFCDLAGSERTAKAQTSGVSQKEANNINSSLLALGRCIDVLRRNQINPSNANLVPFRDSKLTRLFQTYLSGNGLASMIVCINPDPQLFDETIQVLKFSALAREVVLHEKKKVDAPQILRNSHFIRLGLNTPEHKSSQYISDNDNDWNDEDEDIEETMLEDEDLDDEFAAAPYIEVIEALKAEILKIKAENRANEQRITDELNNKWSEQILDMQDMHANRMEEMREKMNKNLLKAVKAERNASKKRRYDSSNDSAYTVADLEIKLAEKEEELTIKNEELAALAKKLQELENDNLVCELATAEKKAENRKTDASNYSIVTIEADMSSTSNSSIGSRGYRFSSFSADRKFKANKTVEQNDGFVPNYMGPLQSPERLKSNLLEPATIKKKTHLFEINEEDLNDESMENQSFLMHESDLTIHDLKATVASYEFDKERMTVENKEILLKYKREQQQNQEMLQKLMNYEKKLMSQDNTHRFMEHTVDSIARNIGVLPSDSTVDIEKKLQLILNEIVNKGREKLNVVPEIDEKENVECSRQKRSHDPEVNNNKNKRSRRRK